LKLVAFFKAFNEADYIWNTLSSIYEVCDKIVVIEGSDRLIPRGRFDPVTGTSVDLTSEIVEEFIEKSDADHRVVYIKEGANVLRREVTHYANDYLSDGDLYLMCNGYEFYDVRELSYAKNFLCQHKNINRLGFKHLEFWLTMHQLLSRGGNPDIKVKMGRWPICTSEEPYNYLTESLIIYDVDHVCSVLKFLEEYIGERQCAENALFDENLFFEAIYQGKAFTRDYNEDELVVPYNGPWPDFMKDHPWFYNDEKDFHVNAESALRCLPLFQMEI